MTRPSLPVRFTGSNSFAEYFKVNGTNNVLYSSHKTHPLVCLDCKSNSCDHCKAVEDHLAEHGVAA